MLWPELRFAVRSDGDERPEMPIFGEGLLESWIGEAEKCVPASLFAFFSSLICVYAVTGRFGRPH
jgi:hypothetical protein